MTDDSIEEKAIAAIHNIIATILTGVSITAADMTVKALGPMIKYFQPAAKILRAAASVSG